MEEDIKVLKRIYKGLKFEDSEGRIAIENLIKGYKELEEEDVKMRAKFVLSLQDYIPKSKVREKIEFYKRYGKIKNSDEYVMSVEIEILEELLQDKEEINRYE